MVYYDSTHLPSTKAEGVVPHGLEWLVYLHFLLNQRSIGRIESTESLYTALTLLAIFSFCLDNFAKSAVQANAPAV